MNFAKRKRKDGSWSYFCEWREGGKRRRHTFKGLNEKLARLAFGEIKMRHARGGLAIPTQPNLTVAECLESYLESKRVNCVARYIRNLKSCVRQTVAFFGESALVQSLSEKSIHEFINAMKAQGHAPPTINKKIGILKSAIAKAVKAGKIAKNPLEYIEKQSDRREPVLRFLSDEEIDRLLDVCENGATITIQRRNGRNYKASIAAPKGLYPLVVFLLNTGARLGEALSVRWQDVNFSTGKVQLLTTKKAARGRTAKLRFVPMNQALREMLKGLEREGEKVFNPGINIRRKFQRAIELAGITRCRIHDLRHTFASHLAMNGTPLNTIRELLGHSTITMTLRYAHLSPETTAEAVQALSFGSKKEVAKVVSIGRKESR